ncbi:MAG: ferrous iron transport protein A [Deltaproteobacteria bacterium]|nr:ferrous iron transport protein A [Deltaproteobacteria bacterium]
MAVPVPAPSPPAPAAPSLDTFKPGDAGTIVAIEVEPAEAGLIRAMGLEEGESVSLLRTGMGGDPLHVRLGSGGEFALARPLARMVRVQRAP